MPFPQSDLTALDAARKQGARRGRFQDKDFELDFVDDYIKLRGDGRSENVVPVPAH
jgi:hypothetical protein